MTSGNADLFDRSVLVVSGKGRVGKTVVAAACARVAHRVRQGLLRDADDLPLHAVAQARQLLDSINVNTIVGLRDRAIIARLLLDRRTPSICAFREVMEAGALMSYGVNLVDVFRDVAVFVDQVARGSKAGDVPMREPSHFHTAFNLKTAKTLGLEIPPTLLARADEVIE